MTGQNNVQSVASEPALKTRLHSHGAPAMWPRNEDKAPKQVFLFIDLCMKAAEAKMSKTQHYFESHA